MLGLGRDGAEYHGGGGEMDLRREVSVRESGQDGYTRGGVKVERGVGVKVTEDLSWRKFGKVRQQKLRFQRR